MGYCSETDVEAIVGFAIDNTTTPNTTQVATFTTWADDYINRFTGSGYVFTFAPTAAVTDEIHEVEAANRDYFSGDEKLGERVLFLDHFPIVGSITSCYYNSGSDKAVTWSSLTEGTDFFIRNARMGELYFNTRPYPLQQGVKVSYVQGHSSTPTFIKELSATLVAIMILMAKGGSANAEDLGSIALGDLHVDYGGTSTSTGSGELISNLGARRDTLLAMLRKPAIGV